MKISPRKKGETWRGETEMRDYRQSLIFLSLPAGSRLSVISLRENERLLVVQVNRDE